MGWADAELAVTGLNATPRYASFPLTGTHAPLMVAPRLHLDLTSTPPRRGRRRQGMLLQSKELKCRPESRPASLSDGSGSELRRHRWLRFVCCYGSEHDDPLPLRQRHGAVHGHAREAAQPLNE